MRQGGTCAEAPLLLNSVRPMTTACLSPSTGWLQTPLYMARLAQKPGVCTCCWCFSTHLSAMLRPLMRRNALG
jgi:hypothetical protein